jgi:hypothetical protein
MMINPGGYLDPEDIVGREAEIARYWRVLERQGLVISAERRIGKTQILRKMQAVGKTGFVTFYQELERVHSLTELVAQLYRTVDHILPTLTRLKAKVVEAFHVLSIERIGDLKLPQAAENWKPLLTAAIKDVLDVVQPDRTVFMWDELPLMLHNLARREGADKTIQLLDLLRHIRQVHGEHVRFLFTGSVGLHLVLKSLRAQGNANDPTNDMQNETVPPMSDADTRLLAQQLAGCLTHAPADASAIAERAAGAIGGFPYHLHHVFDRLDQLGRPATLEDVGRAVDELVFADNDPAHLSYNVERIETYYDAADQPVALATLDAVAASDEPLTMEGLTNLVRHKLPHATETHVKDICLLLRQDHYLGLDPGGRRYDFRWPLVKRWWRENRL